MQTIGHWQTISAEHRDSFWAFISLPRGRLGHALWVHGQFILFIHAKLNDWTRLIQPCNGLRYQIIYIFYFKHLTDCCWNVKRISTNRTTNASKINHLSYLLKRKTIWNYNLPTNQTNQNLMNVQWKNQSIFYLTEGISMPSVPFQPIFVYHLFVTQSYILLCLT